VPDVTFRRGEEVHGPPGTVVRYDGLFESRGADVVAVLQFVMDVAANVTATVIAAWIISSFRGRADKVAINRRERDLDDEGHVRRVVEEEIGLNELSLARSSERAGQPESIGCRRRLAPALSYGACERDPS
jgi:hypothetical protein